MGLSRIAKECKECKECSFKYICNKKKMVAYAEAPNSMSNTEQASQPIIAKYTPITINLGGGEQVQTSLGELKKQLEKDFYEKSGLGISKIK
ncbi:hypothetical protein [Terrisporobacter glycolicus]|nr:hypothetical protein [Terrisporobacter glycolicus]